jgi:hypothetical protein
MIVFNVSDKFLETGIVVRKTLNTLSPKLQLRTLFLYELKLSQVVALRNGNVSEKQQSP